MAAHLLRSVVHGFGWSEGRSLAHLLGPFGLGLTVALGGACLVVTFLRWRSYR